MHRKEQLIVRMDRIKSGKLCVLLTKGESKILHFKDRHKIQA